MNERSGADGEVCLKAVELRPVATIANGDNQISCRRISFSLAQVAPFIGQGVPPKRAFVVLHERSTGREIARGIANYQKCGRFYFTMRIPDGLPLRSKDFYSVSVFEPVIEVIKSQTVPVVALELGSYSRVLQHAYEVNGSDDPWRSVMNYLIHELLEAGEKAGLKPHEVVGDIMERFPVSEMEEADQIDEPDLDQAV